MKAKKHSKRLIACLLAGLMLLPMTVACQKEPAGAGTDTTVSDEGMIAPAPLFDLVKDGKSQYAIVYDNSNKLDADTATLVWKELQRQCGVSLSLRPDTNNKEEEIVVGAADRAQIAELDAALADADDFIIEKRGAKLFLYAKTVKGVKKMLIALSANLTASKENKQLSIAADLKLQGSKMSPEALQGKVLTLCSNGKSDYKIVYSDANDDNERVAYFLRSEFRRICGVEVQAANDRTKEQSKEIIIGLSASGSRPAFKEAKKLMSGEGDFVVTVSGEQLVLVASDAAALAKGVEYIVQNFLSEQVQGTVSVCETDEYRHKLGGSSFVVPAERWAYLCSEVLDRYATMYDFYLEKSVSSAGREDQALCDALVARMGGSAVFCVGKTVALWNGLIRTLDRVDYSAAATLSGDDVLIPADFANLYFGEGSATARASLKTLAAQKGYTYYYDAANQLAIVAPAEVASFATDAEKQGGYSNLEYRNRMASFFNNPEMPTPGNNTEQSRVVIEDATDYYPENSLDFETPIYTNYYSPAILTAVENGRNVLYTGNERCKTQYGAELSTVTVIHKSTDGGKTWTEFAQVPGVSWSSLFLVNGKLYGIGTTFNVGVVIFRVESDGSFVKKTLCSGTSTGVFEPIISNGILYAPFDYCVASVEIDKDIMEPYNWSFTQNVSSLITRNWFESASGKRLDTGGGLGSAACMEGSAVKGPDGKIYAIYRIECHPYGDYAVMLEVSEDRRSLSLLPDNKSLISLPTTVSRFNIKYDAESGYYVNISNWWTVDSCCRARNVIGISVSRDLINWTKLDTLLVDREMMNSEASCWAHAYQYPDWDFDGDDIVIVIREATGYTNTFHDGKYFTFYRLSDFRSML